MLSVALATFFNLAWTLPAFLFALWEKGKLRHSVRNLVFCAGPLATGALLLLWFKVETGNYFYFFQIEKLWQVGFGTPLAQAEYLLCPSGQGTFTCQAWEAQGVLLTPIYWFVRNLLFEVFYVFGAIYLLRTKLEHRGFLLAYSLSVILPLFFILGFAAMSIPRLLLPAFPVFASYAALLKKDRYCAIYVVTCIVFAGAISAIQYFAVFS